MNCDSAILALTSRWNEELTPAGDRELDAHLETCAACREEAARLTAIWREFDSLPVPEPSPAMRVRFQDTLDQYIAEHGNPPQAKRGFSWWPERPVWQIAIAACTLMVGLVAGSVWQKLGQDHVEIAKLRTEVASTREIAAMVLLRDNTASARLKGVDYTGRMPRLDPVVTNALIEAARSDSNVNVRLAAIDALTRASGDSQVRASLAQSIPSQDSPMVQAAIIDYLVDAHDSQSSPTLRQLLNQPQLDPAVKQRASRALQILSQ